MSIEQMKNTSFDKVDFQQWKDLTVQSLKGKPYETLLTKTFEGIELQPLYIGETPTNNATHIQQMKGESGWTIAQQTIAKDGATFIQQLRHSLERGNEAIVYDGRLKIDWTATDLDELSSYFSVYPVIFLNIDKSDPALAAFDRVPHEVRSSVKGIVDCHDWTAPVGYDNLRTIGVDTWNIHHRGADAVTELAFTLAEASRLVTHSTSFKAFSNLFFARFAVDTHFFMEIAKLRAFRLLWKAFSTSFEQTEVPEIPVMAVTSVRSYSKLDPYVNLLRAGNETFAAILGGADIITTHPHTVLTEPDASSIRYARNIQLVLKEETHVDKVIDPAGGSYYIEQLTNELVEKAWALFLQLEQEEDINQFIDRRLAGICQERQGEVAKGKKALIGTNAYAELTDTNFHNWEGIEAFQRLAIPFENMRKQFSVQQPKTVILTFGLLKEFKPRADFVTSYLSAGGVKTTWSPAFQRVEEAIEWMQHEQPEYIVVCAQDDQLHAIMDELLERIPANCLVDVAGKVDELSAQRWKEKGLNGFILNGQDKIAKLHSIYAAWKGVDDK